MVGEDLPPSVRGDQRVTTMTAGQERFPLVPSMFEFRQHGATGTWVSDLMPHTAKIVDELTFIKSMHTEAINHDPGITFFQTGAQLAGRPSMGAWLSYGLGSMNADLPTFVAMISKGSAQTGQPLYDRLWGSGFLPTRYQGVKFLSTGDPVLYLSNPPGVDQGTRRRYLDDLGALNRLKEAEYGDPETGTRIAQYEMAYRMQSSVPELTDLSDEPDSTFELYGPDSRTPGTFARNCLLARRLAERDVRFIQCFHRGWDQHTRLPRGIQRQARTSTRPRPRSSPTSSSAASSTTPSSSGAASSAAAPTARASSTRTPTGATITPAASPSGWPAAASSPASPTARATTSRTTSPATRCTSTTCTPRCSTSWASTTPG